MTKNEIRLSVLKSIEAYCISEKLKHLVSPGNYNPEDPFERIERESHQDLGQEWLHWQTRIYLLVQQEGVMEKHPYLQTAEEFEKTGDLQPAQYPVGQVRYNPSCSPGVAYEASYGEDNP